MGGTVSFFDQFPEFEGQKVEIRGIDGYFSAADMGRAMSAFDGKSHRFNDWTRTAFAKRLLKRISDRAGIPIDYADLRSQTQTPLIDYIRGGTTGVWIHPYVAISYAMSVPEFQAEVNIWIVDMLTMRTVNPHVLQWSPAEYLRGMEMVRDDIEEIYGKRDRRG